MIGKQNTEESEQPQHENRKPDILILDESPAATQPETSAWESTRAAEPEHDGQGISETKTSGSAAAIETEPAKVYSVEAFEKTMYATANVNVRTSYTTDSKALAILTPGQKVKITGKSANGWMRIIYDGRDAFAGRRERSEGDGSRDVTAACSNSAATVQQQCSNRRYFRIRDQASAIAGQPDLFGWSS